ncbi:MAG: N-acetyltransferase [Gammaproteobacteria bacterium]|nr:N-acetyltransferase [Gammaproteobacteria bacterium]
MAPGYRCLRRCREKAVADSPRVHPQALCESSEVGSGTRIWAFAHVMPGARIGRDCNIGGHVFVESGAVLGDRVTVKNGALIWEGVTLADDVFVGPGVAFTNDRLPRSPRAEDDAITRRYARPEDWLVATRVEQGASLGAGAVILCGLRIGAWAMVAAGAVVTRDVPPHACVMGSPARVRGRVCRCGAPLDTALECAGCGRSWTIHGDGLSPA